MTAAAVRLIKVTNDPCLLVLSDSESGTTQWWRRAERCPRVWLEGKQSLSECSIAGDVARGAEAPAKAEQIDPAAWFEHIDGHENFIVYEETMKLGRYSTIMTLLSVGLE